MDANQFADARILIVDDEPANVRLLERLLGQAGYRRVVGTTEPRDVLALGASAPPDLVLLDLLMPHLDGFAVIEQLRQHIPEGDFLPILVLTADITAAAKERALALGAKDFLTKPFDRTEALLRIRNLLETRFLYARLQQQNQTLEEKVRERTQELREAYEAASEASQLKSEFLGTISHELRTPMTHIIGMTHLLLATPLDARQQEFAGIVRDAADHLFGLISDMLDFSALDAGKVTLTSVDFDPREVVATATRAAQAAAQEKGLTLSSNVASEVPPILRGDADRVARVLRHLVSNAVKFTERGEVEIRASATAAEQDVRLYLSVRDTGIGISDAQRARLFQPFTQVDGSLTRLRGGTGLGLVIAKRLVDLMGGKIGVESVAGQGSTFWFMIPLKSSGTSSTRAASNV